MAKPIENKIICSTSAPPGEEIIELMVYKPEPGSIRILKSEVALVIDALQSL